MAFGRVTKPPAMRVVVYFLDFRSFLIYDFTRCILQGENSEPKGTIPMPDETSNIRYGKKRFGVIAVQHGFITPEQLIEALKTQVEGNLDGGPHRLIGEILQKEGTMTYSQIGEVLMGLGMVSNLFGP
jgi:hypothetical protein